MACKSEDLNLTSEEANRLKNAFQNEEFLKLFHDYVEDVNSAKSREAFEEEIIALEKERGFDVKFVHPVPVYVLKFVVTNDEKVFINVCKNHFVREPTSERKNAGSEWKIPAILSKPREDLDKKRMKCTVIDVMFHPTTVDLACRNTRFKGMVEDTAASLVKEQFSIVLNVKSAIRPKLKYKGKAPPVILRQNPKQGDTCEPIEDYYKKLISNKPTQCSPMQSTSKFHKSKEPEKSSFMVQNSKEPEYSIRYRDILDLKDYSLMGYSDKVAPKQIVVEIHLPEVQKATEVELDVFEKKIKLKSCSVMDHNYDLDLNLSYSVDKNGCVAKFDGTKKVLEIVLPVKERELPRSTCGDYAVNQETV